MRKKPFASFVFILIIIALFLSACSEPASIEQNNKKTVTPFKSLQVNDKELGELKFKGDLVLAKSWQDNNGLNFLLLSQLYSEKEDPEMGDMLTTRELYAYHYTKKSGQLKQLRKFQDWEKECFFDNRARFINDAVTITDLDNNNYGEATFVYRLACLSELDAETLKLILTENGKKYAIRGTTDLDAFGQLEQGKTNIDSSFSKAPKEFLEHARQVWKKNQAL